VDVSAWNDVAINCYNGLNFLLDMQQNPTLGEFLQALSQGSDAASTLQVRRITWAAILDSVTIFMTESRHILKLLAHSASLWPGACHTHQPSQGTSCQHSCCLPLCTPCMPPCARSVQGLCHVCRVQPTLERSAAATPTRSRPQWLGWYSMHGPQDSSTRLSSIQRHVQAPLDPQHTLLTRPQACSGLTLQQSRSMLVYRCVADWVQTMPAHPQVKNVGPLAATLSAFQHSVQPTTAPALLAYLQQVQQVNITLLGFPAAAAATAQKLGVVSETLLQLQAATPPLADYSGRLAGIARSNNVAEIAVQIVDAVTQVAQLVDALPADVQDVVVYLAGVMYALLHALLAARPGTMSALSGRINGCHACQWLELSHCCVPCYQHAHDSTRGASDARACV
jgi:hypothetical protein